MAVATLVVGWSTPATVSCRGGQHVHQDAKIGGLPVIDRSKLVGIITATDLLRAFSKCLVPQKKA